MRQTWVQDKEEIGIVELIEDMTFRNLKKMPKGSRYIIGRSKCGTPGYLGIYFEDPTANNSTN